MTSTQQSVDTTPEPAKADDSGTRVGGRGVGALRDYGILFSFVLLFIVLSVASPVFLSSRNLLNVLDQSATIGIIAAGGTLVMIAGGLDLSTGAIFALTGVIASKYADSIGIVPAMLLALFLAVVLGWINGLLATKGRINSIIATLGTGIVFRGIALAVTAGFLFRVESDGFTTLGRGTALGMRYSSWMFLLIVAITWFLLSRTAFGRYIYASGGNQEAARLSGVRVHRIRIITFVVSAACAGIAGLLVASRVATGQADSGIGLEITAIAAIVIGGTSIAGGEGAIWRTVLGVLLLTLVGNGFNLLNIDPIYQQIFQGAIILVAVGIDAWSREDVAT